MSTKSKLEIYTNETCPYCKQIKEELTKNNIEFEERLTPEFQDEWNNVASLTRLPTTPTISFKNNCFVPMRDFNSPQNLIDILNNFEECTFPIERQIFEKIKTLKNLVFLKNNKFLK